MKTYVALLRAINLAGRNKVSMAELRALFLALGSEDVTTHLQSGNVVFTSPVGSSAELRRRIEERLGADLGLNVTVLLRTSAELGRVAGGNPFVQAGRERTALHVTFLADRPGGRRVADLDPKRSEPDEFRVVEREVYLYCPNGYGRSKLDNAWFEKQLGVRATTRNWKTVTRLAELAGA